MQVVHAGSNARKQVMVWGKEAGKGAEPVDSMFMNWSQLWETRLLPGDPCSCYEPHFRIAQKD